MKQEHIDRRMSEDAAMIADPSRWPPGIVALCLKTQPWFKGERQYGVLMPGTLVVRDHDDGAPIDEYPSIADMVQKWSVD